METGMMMLKFVFPCRASSREETQSAPPTVKQDFTCSCPNCHRDLPLEASHCSHCRKTRPNSAMIERSRLLNLLHYFFRNDYQQQHVEVEINTLRELQKGQQLMVPLPAGGANSERDQVATSADSQQVNIGSELGIPSPPPPLPTTTIAVATNEATHSHIVNRKSERASTNGATSYHSSLRSPESASFDRIARLDDNKKQAKSKIGGATVVVKTGDDIRLASIPFSPCTPVGIGIPATKNTTVTVFDDDDQEEQCQQESEFSHATGVASRQPMFSETAPPTSSCEGSVLSESGENQSLHGNDHAADRIAKPRKCRLKELKNHLQSGIHDHTALYLEKVPSESPSRTTRSRFKWENLEVCRRSWTDQTVLTAENPVHFPRGGYVEPRLVGVAAQLKVDFVKLCADKNASCNHISTATEIKPSYLKGHLEEPFVSNVFAFTIPPCLLIKRRADQKAIAFVTTDEPSQCDTHYDRDTSLLLVLAGKKEVYLAPPRQRWQDEVVVNNSTIFESLDPFLDVNRGTLGGEWKQIVMEQGDALLIPRKWLHAVRSHCGTVAVSFQVEIAPIPYDVSSYLNLPGSEEDQVLTSLVAAAEALETEQSTAAAAAAALSRTQEGLDDSFDALKELQVNASEEDGKEDAERETENVVEMSISQEQTPADSKKMKKKRKAAAEVLVPLAAKRRLSLQQRSSLEATLSRRVVSRRGGRRTRYECDWCDCAGFAKDGEMWFLRLADEKDMDESVLPMVTDNPVKFLCLSCVPRRGTSVVNPEVILEYPDELAAVQKYNFYLGTKVDYQVWSGEYKKEQFL